MTEYIEKKAIRDALYDADAITMEGVKILNQFPVADAVKVVRCGKCEKCLVDNTKREIHLCMKRPSFPVLVKLDGFCSDGERRTDDA